VSTATPRQRPAPTTPGPAVRVVRAWRALSGEQRLSAIAALSLWVTMFLPWYSESPAGAIKKGESVVTSSLTAWGAFSWVEAAVLVVSVGVLSLLFARGERRAFHLPGGDGGVIVLAGGWTALLIIYRMFDKNSLKAGNLAITVGNEWGIFFALFAAIWLTWTGVSMRRAHRAEPALSEDPSVRLPTRPPLRERRAERARTEAPPRRERIAPASAAAARERAASDEDAPRPEHRGVTREDAEQLSFELPDVRRDKR
jgi:hypothetical protein